MLNIYYGGESEDKEKFIFEQVKGKTLLLVPDQFSLQAEKDAFFYMNRKSLIDLQVVDFSALGHKVVNEVGGIKPPLIDKYGRHMLLVGIIGNMEQELNIYRGFAGKSSFVNMMNSMISEMKRFEVEPKDLSDVMRSLDDRSFLKYKLEDIEKIYDAYSRAVEGKYLDSEDYITFYGEKILNSAMIAESEVWIYGFDTFTPKNFLVIERLLKTATAVNVVMTYEETVGIAEDAAFLTGLDREDLFSLTGYMIKKLKELAEELNEEWSMTAIEGEKRRTIWTVGLPDNAPADSFAAIASGAPDSTLSGEKNRQNNSRIKSGEEPLTERTFAITMARTSNIYTEAERAAAYILELVREEGFKFGEIVVVCNDTEVRGAVLKRTFKRWGIPVFMDKKRKVLHHPAVSFLLAFMEIISAGYRDDSVMKLLKSGLLNLSAEDMEIFENYVCQYRIRGSMWKNNFTRGGDKYSAEDLNRLNIIRQAIVDITERARDDMGRRNTASEKIKGLYGFLKEDFMIMERLSAVMEEQQSFGLSEGAAETAQSWTVLCNILDQILETVGEEKISNEDLAELMKAGFEEVEIGLVPVDSDSVIIGTVQRTRLSRIRALVVTGANEGVLPLEKTEEGLLSEREKEILEGLNFEIAGKGDTVRREEQLALYRNFSLPEERLYMSCSGADESGETLRPSAVFNALITFMQSAPSFKVLGDPEEDSDIWCMLGSRTGALPYMAEALRKRTETGRVNRSWLQVMNWYEENSPEDFGRIKRGMIFDNRLEIMGRQFADDLYRGDKESLEVSASRLEKYSGCPFAHFVGYGLKAEEFRVFEMGAREIGDVYHECLMKFSRELNSDEKSEMSLDDQRSPWMTVSPEECRESIRRIIMEDMYGYNEGIFALSKAEEYRTERITEICSQVAWSMIEQVRKGKIRSMAFEKPFGRGCKLPPVAVNVGDREVLIRGKIDRMDILKCEPVINPNSEQRTEDSLGEDIDTGNTVAREQMAESGEGSIDAVRIVDYKTGAAPVNVDYFRNGYKLQLMIYLKAAMQGSMSPEGNEPDLRPAGVFHFRIKELDTDGDLKKEAGSDDLPQRLQDAYRLEGIVIDEPQLINAMDSKFDKTSQVIPVKYKKDGSFAVSGGGSLLSDEEFRELYEQVDIQVEQICRGICDGNIAIQPKRERVKDMDGGYRNSCKYCSYKSICMFDTTLEGCSFKQV